jgi:phospholipid/cholesterol/gamma-HCH transport system permease protein
VRIGRGTLTLLADAGRMALLSGSTLDQIVLGPVRRRPLRLRPTLAQVARAGTDSLPLVALIMLLVGMILGLQSAEQLDRFGVVDLVAGLVSVSVARELAPLLTAIIVAGRVGSSIAAELGTRQVDQEIDALTVMGIDPVHFLVAPRVAGLLIALPCLTVFGDAVGILGGFFVGVGVLDLGATSYLMNSLTALTLEDVWGGILKAAAFAAIIGVVGCERGLATRGGAEQVGRSTTAAVVRSIVLVIAADLFVTGLLYAGGGA